MFLSKLKAALAALTLFALVGITAASLAGPGAPPPPEANRSPAVQETASGGEQKKQGAKWQDLLGRIDPDRYTVGKGIWRVKDGKVTAYPAAHGARLRIPVVPKGNYELRARWQPKHNDSSVHFIVPHGPQGDRMASVEVLGRLRCAGLGDLNGVRPDINETKKDFEIKPGKVYDVYIRMTVNGGQVHVLAKLDDTTVVDWEGKRSELEHEFFAPPKPASLGLAVSDQVSVFHSLELRMLSGTAEEWKPAKRN